MFPSRDEVASRSSWTRWTHFRRLVPGCFALSRESRTLPSVWVPSAVGVPTRKKCHLGDPVEFFGSISARRGGAGAAGSSSQAGWTVLHRGGEQFGAQALAAAPKGCPGGHAPKGPNGSVSFFFVYFAVCVVLVSV